MNNSTLGGLIKDYRIQKGISQLDIAFSLGWKEPSRLSRIEQGRTEKPTREVLDKIIVAIGLKEEETNTLLLTGGYLPTEEEIEEIREETKQILEEWPYPSYIFDYSWRIIMANKQVISIYKVSPDVEKAMYKHHPRVLDMLFDSNFRQNKLLNGEGAENWKSFLKIAILNFKYEQKRRTREKWYIDHIKELMKNNLFRELWVDIDTRDKLKGIVGKFTPKDVIHPKNNGQFLRFFRFSAPILKDPRFEIEYLIPRDLETYKYYNT